MVFYIAGYDKQILADIAETGGVEQQDKRFIRERAHAKGNHLAQEPDVDATREDHVRLEDTGLLGLHGGFPRQVPRTAVGEILQGFRRSCKSAFAAQQTKISPKAT